MLSASSAAIDIQKPQLILASSRRSLQETAASVGLDTEPQPEDSQFVPESDTDSSEDSGYAEAKIGDTFFAWFVLVGIAWCIYHGCKPGGCCRGGSTRPQALPEGPVGTHQLAIGMPAGHMPPGQHWTPAGDPRTGVAVTHVHINQHPPVQRWPTVPKVAPKEMYRVGSHRWSVTPVEPDAEEKQALAGQEGSNPVTGTSQGIERFHSAASVADPDPVYLPPPIYEEATNSHNAEADAGVVAAPGVSQLAANDTQQQPQQHQDDKHSDALAAIAGGGSMMDVSEKECVICYDDVGDHVMVPCGHGGFCGRCAKDMCSGHAAPYTEEGGHVCPVCRAPVDTVVKVSLSTTIGERSNAECALIVEPGPPVGPPSQDVIPQFLQFAVAHPMTTVHAPHMIAHPHPGPHHHHVIHTLQPR